MSKRTFEADEDIIAVQFDGKEYEVRVPGTGELRDYTKAIKALGDDADPYPETVKFLIVLGLPEEVQQKLSPAKTHKLIDILVGSEKKGS